MMIDANIGSAKDNIKSAIHNWYKFTAGFSYKFVDLIVDNMDTVPNCIYEPFAGCGTTLVAAQKKGISSIGNESQKLMCDVINAKLNWDINLDTYNQYMHQILHYVKVHNNIDVLDLHCHELLEGLYDKATLKELYLIRDAVRLLNDEKYELFFNLAISQTLHKSAIHPIAVPYIVRSKKQVNCGNALEKFQIIAKQMLEDLSTVPHSNRLAKVYNADSRKRNNYISDSCCDLCITSPPYLNNLDYGEVSKVHTHFFELTNNWHDITEKVRHNLVTGATTHYKDAEEMYRIISRDAFAFIKNLNDGKESAYSRFMANATFLIQSPRTLTKIVEGINALDMNNRDTMGDVYEYVLSKMAASGNNGQFRTPRHIIRMMVELMQPTLKDTICDPAMGSAGFIVESAKYIQQHYKSELLKKEHSEHYKSGMLHGFDTDATMLRIGAMNLMLHGVDNPDIAYRDSLSTDNTDENKYTLCLANPPFTGSLDNEAVSKSLLAITKTKKTELLFLALFVRMLQTGGRCASIVPDGVLFGNSTGHKSIRKELIDNHRLEAVISMPSGVFKPYAGVSTAILIFTKTNAGGTDKVWFYDMKADGFSLDDKRNPTAQNDSPDVVARFHNLEGEAERTRKEQSFLVPVEEIREKGYDLSMNKYKEVEREAVVYDAPETIMERITTLETGIQNALVELKKMI